MASPRRRGLTPREIVTLIVLAALLLALTLLLIRPYLPQRNVATENPPPPATTTSAPAATLPATLPMDRGMVYAGVPKPTQPDRQVQVLTNLGYMVGYSNPRKNPLWAAYRLFAVSHPKTYPRPQRFSVDLRTTARVRSEDYTKGMYGSLKIDRGHLAPNHAIATRYGPAAQLETFLMSNICPQTHLLNDGPWGDLEALEAYGYANELEEIWVVGGPLFAESPPEPELASGVPIPVAFYKILVDEEAGQPRALAFIFPQPSSPEQMKPREPLDKFLSSVRDIEKRSHLDFFWQLPREQQERLETQKPQRLWETQWRMK